MPRTILSPRGLCCVSLLWVLLTCAASGAEDSIREVLERVRYHYRPLEAFQVPYQREVITRSMALLGASGSGDRAWGVLSIRPPSMLRLDQERPEHEILVSDGQTLWWYVPRKQTVYIYPADRFGRELGLLAEILHGLRGIEEEFTAILLPSGDPETDLLELRPLSPWEEVDRVRVMVNKTGRITQVEIVNPLGSVTRFRLRNETPLDPSQESLFHFVPPPGVKVERHAPPSQ